jgi:hypothetical protein
VEANSFKTLTSNAKNSNSLMTHENPAELLRNGAGKGEWLTSGRPSLVGGKERFDFHQEMGIWKNIEGTAAFPTTRGIIHYDTKGGAHIVLSSPDDLLSRTFTKIFP